MAERDTTQAEVERLWAEDRSRLIDCKGRHGALVDYYESRDGALR